MVISWEDEKLMAQWQEIVHFTTKGGNGHFILVKNQFVWYPVKIAPKESKLHTIKENIVLSC